MNAKDFVAFLIAAVAGYLIFSSLTSYETYHYVLANTMFVFFASVLIIYAIYMWIGKQMRGASR